jgi:Mrp family chromosome partitioning ATPase
MSKNFELLQKLGKEQNLFHISGNSSGAVKDADYKQAATPETTPGEPEPKKPEPKKPEVRIRWPQMAKEKVARWRDEIPTKTPRSTGFEKIKRREEVKLVQRIFHTGDQRGPQVVIFSGVETGCASPIIGARISEILAAGGQGPVCIVDANLEAPFLHRYFHLDNSKGLSDAILDSGQVQDFTHHLSETNLWVMPSGSANIKQHLPGSSDRLRSIMIELRTLFKYVVIDLPLYLDRAPIVHSFAADGLVLVVEANSTRRETVRELMKELQMLRTRVLGVVLNNRTFPIPEAIYQKL